LGVVDRASVTVVAADGATADGLGTAVYVLGPERGLALVASVEGAAALILRRENGALRTYESKRFRELFGNAPGDERSDGKGAGASKTRSQSLFVPQGRVATSEVPF